MSITRTPLASVDDLAAHTSVTIESDEAIALAQSMLRAASSRVRNAGSDDWEDYNAPDIAITITLEAAARGFLNPAGYELERGDQLTIQRGDMELMRTALTSDEISELREAAGVSTGLSVVTVSRVDKVSDKFWPPELSLDVAFTYS